MHQLVRSAARLSAAVVLAGAMCGFGPAGTAHAADTETVTVGFADECGRYVKVSVGNTSTAPLGYTIGVEDVDATPFTVAAGATAVHVWPVHSGKRLIVTSAGLASAKEHSHREPGECRAPDLDFDGELTCLGIVVLASNEGEVGADIRVTRNGSQAGGLLTVPAGGKAHRLVTMVAGDVINLQRQTGGENPQWVTVLDGVFEPEAGCGRLPSVELTDTCTGVHVKTVNTTQAELVLELEGLPPLGPAASTHTVAAGATFAHDVTVAEGALLGAAWKDPDTMMAAIDHGRSTDCASGGGGGLPVTGANIAMFAGVGLLLVAAGAGVFLLTRRRRRSV